MPPLYQANGVVLAAGSPGSAHGRERHAVASGRPSSARSTASAYPTAANPRSRGELTRGYEGRHGTSSLLHHDRAHEVVQAKIAKKPGLVAFTDPTRPSSRPHSKQMIRLEDHRGDTRRAGARTRNPGVMPAEQSSGARANSEDGRSATVPFSYSENSHRPAKRVADHVPQIQSSCCGDHRATPRGGEGAAMVLSPGVLPITSALGNYLNDMKRCKASLRTVKGEPSEALRRKNDERHWLPADRQAQLGRSVSCDSSLYSCRRGVANAESDKEDNYGFNKKREVGGNWTPKGSSRLDLLHHPANPPVRLEASIQASSASLATSGAVATPRGHTSAGVLATPRAPSRSASADARFTEMVAHMRASNPQQRQSYETLKTRGENSLGIFDDVLTPRRAA